MNYLREIILFERWLETNYLPSASQLLWYKLMSLCNRCGWAEWISVENCRLMGLLQIRREATFLEVRDKLVENGRIQYIKGKKGTPNKYKILHFTFTGEVQTEVQTEVQSEVQSEVYTVDINKLNVNKNININNNIKKTNKKKDDPFVDFAKENADLLSALKEFEEMRREMKKPLTTKAKGMIVVELEKLSQEKTTQIAMLNQSVLHNWQSVYGLKTAMDTNIKTPKTTGVQEKGRFDYEEFERRQLEEILKNAGGGAR